MTVLTPSFRGAATILALLVIGTFGLPVALGMTWLPQPIIGLIPSPPEARRPAYSAALDNFSFPYVDWPFRLIEADQIHQGRPPLWNAYSSLGIPLAAQYETQVFFPFEWLAMLTGPRFWSIHICLMVYLAGLGAYLYTRGLAGDSWAALGGSVAYMFSAFFVWFYSGPPGFIGGAAMIPWLLWSVQRVLDGELPRARWIGAVAITVGLVLLSGQPQMSAITLLGTGLYAGLVTLLRLRSLSSALVNAVGAALGACLGVGIAAVMLRLFAETLANGFTLHVPGAYGAARTGYLNAILPIWPFLMGQLAAPWNPTIPSHQLNWEMSPFVPGVFGVLGFALALTRFPWPWNKGAGAHLWALLAVAALAFTIVGLASAGISSPWSSPGLDQINLPRYGAPFMAMIFAALLSWGVSSVATLTATRWLIANVVVLLLAGTSLLVAVPFILNPAPETDWQLFRASLWLGLVPFAVTYVGANAVLLALLRQRTTSERAQLALVVVVVAQSMFLMRYGFSLSDELLRLWLLALGTGSALLIVFGRWRAFLVTSGVTVAATGALILGAPSGLRTLQDPFATTPPVVSFLQSQLGEGSRGGRVISTRGIINPNLLSPYGIADLGAAMPMQIETTAEYMLNVLAVRDTPPNRNMGLTAPIAWGGLVENDDRVSWGDYRLRQRFFGFLGVRYLLDWPDGPLSKNRPAGLTTAYRDNTVVVYEDPSALPRAFAIGSVAVTPDAAAARARLLASNFDIARTALVEDPDGTLPRALIEASSASQRTVTIEAHTHDRVDLVVGDGGLALVVLTDAYYPGWRATVDGESREVYRVNSVVRGVVVEPGLHRLTFSYQPERFGLFAAISLGSATLAIALLFLPSRFTRWRRESTSHHRRSPALPD